MNKRKAARPKRHVANTQDILGSPKPAPRVPAKWRRHYDNLVALRQQLAGRADDLTRAASEELPTFGTHMADAGTDTFDRDLALGMLSSEQDAVYQIDQAIDRIRNGTYGICEFTGKPIERERLEAVPWTRFSLKAEKQLEQQGARKRARLGERDSVGNSAQPEDDSEGEE